MWNQSQSESGLDNQHGHYWPDEMWWNIIFWHYLGVCFLVNRVCYLDRIWVFVSGHWGYDCAWFVQWSCRQQINQISNWCHCRPFCRRTVCLPVSLWHSRSGWTVQHFNLSNQEKISPRDMLAPWCSLWRKNTLCSFLSQLSVLFTIPLWIVLTLWYGLERLDRVSWEGW